jgi:lambda repressor-like predicted transcriptional regulator
MTTAEAKEIDRLEFEAECAAIRERAYAIVQSHKDKKHHTESISAELNEALDEKPYITRHEPRKKTPGHVPKLYTAHGKTLTIAQWSEETGISVGTLRFRLAHGWTMEDAVTRPVGSRLKDTPDEQRKRIGASRGYTALGKTMTIEQWSEETGLPASTIRNRLRQGWLEEDAVTLMQKRGVTPNKRTR